MSMLCTVTCLCSCGEGAKENSAGTAENMSEEDMPYGATITSLNSTYDPNVKIPTEFDNRFFAESDGKFPEIYLVSDYIYALNNSDGELMSETVYKPYLDYQIKEAGVESADEYVKASHDTLAQSLGGEFEINYIYIDSCDENADSDFTRMDEILDSIGDEKISEKVNSRKKITIGGYTTYQMADGSGEFSLAEHSDPILLYIYQIDGEYYLI